MGLGGTFVTQRFKAERTECKKEHLKSRDHAPKEEIYCLYFFWNLLSLYSTKAFKIFHLLFKNLSTSYFNRSLTINLQFPHLCYGDQGYQAASLWILRWSYKHLFYIFLEKKLLGKVASLFFFFFF